MTPAQSRWIRTLGALLPRGYRAEILDDLLDEREAMIQRGSARLYAGLWLASHILRSAVESRLRRTSSVSFAVQQGDPMGKLACDLRYARRSLSVRRGSALVTALVLALGVGLLTAMFALTDPYILRPLPYRDPSQLLTIGFSGSSGSSGSSGGSRGTQMPTVGLVPTMGDFRGLTNLFDGVAAYGLERREDVWIGNELVTLTTIQVSLDFFDVLGVPGPTARSWFPATDTEIPLILTSAGARKLASVAAGTGQQFQRRESGIARVVGRLSPSFVFPSGRPVDADALVPFDPGPLMTITQSPNSLSIQSHVALAIARLKSGVSMEAAAAALAGKTPQTQFLRARVESLPELMTRAVRPLALGALGAGILILLVCAGNVANLHLARGTYRTREFATRRALGAVTVDLVRLWLVEVAVMSATGVVLGLAVAWSALAIAAQVIPAQYVTLGVPALTWRTVSFASLSGVVVVLVGLLPVALVWRFAAPAGVGLPTVTETARLKALRFTFAAMQSAVAMILVVGAAMLVQSYANFVRQPTGYDGNTLVVSVGIRRGAPQFTFDEVVSTLGNLRRIPGVTSVAATNGAVVQEIKSTGAVQIKGQRAPVHRKAVTPDFFETVGTPVLQGRPPGAGDDNWRGVVVNEAFVRRYFSDSSPLGAILERRSGQTFQHAAIVGVVQNAFDQGLASPPEPTVYDVLGPDQRLSEMRYVLRTIQDAAISREAVRRAVAGVNPSALIRTVDTIGSRLSRSVHDRTFATLVLTFFGIAGGAITVAGLVGIVAFVVARRTREIAIRIAIGATRRDVRQLVVREAVTAAVVGGLAGLLAGRWLSTWLESFAYGVKAGNWATATIAGTVMLTVMVGAAVLAARHAVRLQPIQSLRVE